MAFVVYGGLIAIQSLWAGPWLTTVVGQTPAQAAQGLFFINLSMLLAFLAWGTVMPRLRRRGVTVHRLLLVGVPVTLSLLAWAIVSGSEAAAVSWSIWCVACTVISLSQPAVAQVFPSHLAGRALSAYNLIIFAGVFCVQWGIGVAIDLLMASGWNPADATRAAFALFGGCSVLTFAWFVLYRGER
jgi:hypothetical protein